MTETAQFFRIRLGTVTLKNGIVSPVWLINSAPMTATIEKRNAAIFPEPAAKLAIEKILSLFDDATREPATFEEWIDHGEND